MRLEEACLAISGAAICAALAACGPPLRQSSQSAAATPNPAQLAVTERPAEEIALETLLRVAGADPGAPPAGKSVAQDANSRNAYLVYCSTMLENRGAFNNWTAVIDGITAPNAQSPNPGISLVTPGGLGIFQQIDVKSSFYKALRGLKEGDYVKFSLIINKEASSGAGSQKCDESIFDKDSVPHINTILFGELTDLSPLLTTTDAGHQPSRKTFSSAAPRQP